MAKPLVVGLTGPTGAGKSTVASAFAALGCEVIDCDRVAQEVTNRPDCLTALQSAFGNDVVSEGRLNRALLAERAFSNAVSSKKLNGITHPLIMEEVRRRIAASGKKVVVVDAALLFESGADALCRVTVAVVAEPELRMRRIMRRDQITEVGAQQPNAYYTSRASYAMDGGIDAAQVPEETEKLLHVLLSSSS